MNHPDDVEENDKTTLTEKITDNLTFLDLLMKEPVTGSEAVIMSDNKYNPGDDTYTAADLDQDPVFLKTSKTVINFMENLQEIKAKLKPEDDGKYKCVLCGVGLKCRDKMMGHLTAHANSFQQQLKQCDLCDMTLPQCFISQHIQLHSQPQPAVPAIISCVKRDIRNDLARFLISGQRKNQGMFQCRYCNTKINGYRSLQGHFLAKHTVKYVCQLCGASLYLLPHVLEHVRNHKGGQEDINTVDDMANVTDQQEIMNTLEDFININDQKEDSNKDIASPSCQKKSTSKIAGDGHAVAHTDTCLEKFPCTQCNRSFISSSALKTHTKRHSQVYRCTVDGCSKSLANRRDLINHERSHIATGRTKALCSACGQVFSCKARMTEHMEFTHNGREPIKCHVCSTLFRSSEGYRRHMKIHTTVEDKFVCEQCGERFKTSERFAHHKRKHRDKKSYTCLWCNATFRKIGSLEIHLVKNRHFSEEQPESLIKYKTCSHCGLIMTNSRQLRRHIDRVHGKPKICLYCGKQFGDRSNLRIHMQSHTNTKPQCTVCNRVFRSKVKLKEHMDVDHPDMGQLIETPTQEALRQGFVTSVSRDAEASLLTEVEKPCFTSNFIASDGEMAGVNLVSQSSELQGENHDRNRADMETVAATNSVVVDSERFNTIEQLHLLTPL